MDKSKTSDVTVTYQGEKSITSVTDIYGGKATLEDSSASVTVPAGGIVILEYQLQ